MQAAFAGNGLSNVVGKGKGGGICRFIFPILPRRNPVLFFKRFAEMGFGLEADIQGDGQDGIGGLPQQNGGLAQADKINEGVGADAGLLFEQAHELGAGKVGQRGHFFDVPFVFGAADNGLDELAQAFVAQAVEYAAQRCFSALFEMGADDEDEEYGGEGIDDGARAGKRVCAFVLQHGDQALQRGMVHLDEDGFGQVVHDVGVFVVFEAGAEQIEAFFATAAGRFDGKRAVVADMNGIAAVVAGCFAAEDVLGTARKEDEVARFQPPRFGFAFDFDVAFSGDDKVCDAVRAPASVRGVPFVAEQALYVHAACDLRQFDEFVQSVHKCFLPVNEMI